MENLKSLWRWMHFCSFFLLTWKVSDYKNRWSFCSNLTRPFYPNWTIFRSDFPRNCRFRWQMCTGKKSWNQKLSIQWKSFFSEGKKMWAYFRSFLVCSVAANPQQIFIFAIKPPLFYFPNPPHNSFIQRKRGNLCVLDVGSTNEKLKTDPSF